MTQCSLIIATFNRPAELARCLRSLESLHRGFDEVLIVDQGDAGATEDILKNHARLNARVLTLPVPSLTRARNLGIESAAGSFVFFVDDDTTLHPRYVETALDCFSRYPDVVGLTGHIDHGWKARGAPRWMWRRFLALLLQVSSFRWEVMRSGANSAPFWDMGTRRFRDRHGPVSRDVSFLFGCHFACRRRVFDDGFRFDERFIRWGFGEDVMFSYRLYKRYGHGSLAYCPAFTLRHYWGRDLSLSDESAVRMQVIYRFVFWRQEVYEGSLLNALCYVYSQVGFAALLVRRYRHARRRAWRAAWKSYLYLLAHHREIARDRIDYNRFILDG